MTVSLRANKTTIEAGEIVEFYILTDTGEPCYLYAYDCDRITTRGQYSVTTSPGVETKKRLDPSYLGSCTAWRAIGRTYGQYSNWVEINVGVPGTQDYTLQILETANGSTDPPTGTHTYEADTRLAIRAYPDSGYQVQQFIVDGVNYGAIVIFNIDMDRNHTVYVQFEGIPPPEPPPAENWQLTATVTNNQNGNPIAGATVSMNGISKSTNSSGVAVLTGSELKSYSVTASAPGFQPMSTSITFSAYISTSYPFFLNPEPAPSDSSDVVGAIGGLPGLLFTGLSGIGQGFAGGFESTITSALDNVSTSIQPGSPPEDIERTVKKLTATIQKTLDDAMREVYKTSINPEQSPGAAQNIIGLITGGVLAAEIVAALVDLLHPFKSIQLRSIVDDVVNVLGLPQISQNLAGIPVEIGLLQTLRYHYNRVYTPRIPAIQDLITMLVREQLSVDEYIKYASYHGESQFWALKRWDTHWRLPSPEMIKDAFHRGIINESARDQFMIWHDYKPGPRQGIEQSDLAIIAGLQKELIPRVDIRRGWEFGVVSDSELEDHYQKLGYEDDAQRMADIQKNVALAAERTGVVRAAGRLFRDGIWTETEFRQQMGELGFPTPIQDLWVRRYELEAIAKFTEVERPEV